MNKESIDFIVFMLQLDKKDLQFKPCRLLKKKDALHYTLLLLQRLLKVHLYNF